MAASLLVAHPRECQWELQQSHVRCGRDPTRLNPEAVCIAKHRILVSLEFPVSRWRPASRSGAQVEGFKPVFGSGARCGNMVISAHRPCESKCIMGAVLVAENTTPVSMHTCIRARARVRMRALVCVGQGMWPRAGLLACFHGKNWQICVSYGPRTISCKSFLEGRKCVSRFCTTAVSVGI